MIMMHLHPPSTLKVLTLETLERRENFMMGLIMKRLQPARIEREKFLMSLQGTDTLKVLPQDQLGQREKFLMILQCTDTLKVLPQGQVGQREKFLTVLQGMNTMKVLHQ